MTDSEVLFNIFVSKFVGSFLCLSYSLEKSSLEVPDMCFV